MIDYNTRQLRSDQFRQWYYHLPTRAQMSSVKRMLMNKLRISEGVFYKMLRGYTYINPDRQLQITQVLGKEIFV